MRSSRRRGLASCLEGLADALQRTGHAADAESEYHRAVTLRERLAGVESEPADHAAYGAVLQRLALAVRPPGHDETCRLLEAAVNQFALAREGQPDAVTHHQSWAAAQLRLGDALLERGDHAAAARVAQEVADDPSGPLDDARAAELLARCAALAMSDPGRRYAEQAVRALAAAIRKGHLEPVELLRRRSFDGIRDRADFGQLQRQLDAATRP